MRLRISIAMLALMIVAGAMLHSVLTTEPGVVSIGFLHYSTKGGSDLWAVFAITNRSRFDYHYSVITEPNVATDLWHNTPGMVPAGSVVSNEIWIAKGDVPYRLAMQAYRLPVVPSGERRMSLVGIRSAWRFALGKTRLDLMRGTIVPPTNSVFIVLSDFIPTGSER